MSMFNFIVWNADPEIFKLGFLSVRWYGLFFALAFLLGQQVLLKIYKKEGRSEKYVESLTIYTLIATILGARLGHCLFYQPEIYLKHPIEILKIWEGGLASHGAAVGILVALYLYARKYPEEKYLYVLDRVVITVALGGCLIRMGNMMNSEILGRQTLSDYGVVFVHSAQENLTENLDKAYVKKVNIGNAKRDTIIEGQKYAVLNLQIQGGKNVTAESLNGYLKAENKIPSILWKPEESDPPMDHVIPSLENPKIYYTEDKNGTITANTEVYGIPRHPAQLYESFSCLLLFFLLLYLYNKKKERTPHGRIVGLFLVILFTLRFLYEFLKEPQVAFEEEMQLYMGQWLSIPMIIFGLYVLMLSYRKKGEIS
ncbi:MAG: prolipoprotein diacylglyceryl transferase [Cytophagaceae bacterium]